tara:strand:+ start:447 stop:1136 length:690 start_codon:yes stop_codon:yes gene_type:complete
MNLVSIDDYENYMFDRNLNQVYNTKTKKYLKNCLKKGFYFVSLSKNGEQKRFTINYMIYKYNNQYNPDDFVDIYDYEDYKFNLKTNEVININTGNYLTNNINCGYYKVGLYKNNKQKNFKLHRLVFKSHNPLINIEGFDIDHINQDKLDNNINNLRICTRSENQCNVKVNTKNNILGIKNIHKTKDNNFKVQIVKDGKNYNKYFKTLEEAIVYRDLKLSELHKEFACYI